VRQRTMLVNTLRAHLAEFGIVAPQGLRHVEILTTAIAHQQERVLELARSILQTIADQLNGTMTRIQEIEGRLLTWHRESRVSRLLATVPVLASWAPARSPRPLPILLYSDRVASLPPGWG